MHRLSQLILFLFCGVSFMNAQSPHGVTFSMDCAKCHSPESWSFNTEITTFSHDSTSYPLIGQHKAVDCKMCHSDFIFSNTKNDCASCHNDMHFQTVGLDCARCHSSNDWLVPDIKELHENASFPLIGVHAGLSCEGCHISENLLKFDPIGTACINCHLNDFKSTLNPDHTKAGFSTECTDCHNIFVPDWTSTNIDHGFFPLELGHNIQDCTKCHQNGDYVSASTECISCHNSDFLSTTNPNHLAANFSTNCIECHTIIPGWKPAEIKLHDIQYFPIYSGKHIGLWDDCTACHKDNSNYSSFTCITCHTNPETNDVHNGVNGYNYNDNACLACHPMGDADNVFDHNSTNFPLTGAHQNVDCISCHASGYVGTSTACVDCHLSDFQNTNNPNHVTLGLSQDCASCHTTVAGWNPASFSVHNDYYAIEGAHVSITNDCAACHNGNYNNTPNTCYGCHQNDYETTASPNHTTAQFPKDCATCHSQNGWTPSQFDHDNMYFPIYSGKHNGTWNECIDCHSNPNDFSKFTCTTCHTNPETNDTHNGVGGYVYNDNACLACHPTGDADVIFDHDATAFPLTGAHKTTDCISCHSGGFMNTPTDCASCHLIDFNTSQNPNHAALNFPKDCASCHTTAAGWNPATFEIHDQFYILNGAHANIQYNCVQCHNGDYNNTPNTCVGCHQSDYTATTNPNHTAAHFSTDCAQCHGENTWVPANFDHDGMHFPIYSGKHNGVWVECVDCHANSNDFSQFSCTNCHTNPETNDVHAGVGGYIYNDNACLACHPTGDANVVFDHNATLFPLTGAHSSVDCISCHAGGFAGTSTECVSCHLIDFNASINPNHQVLNFPTDCAMCHNTQPGWSPAQFPIHDIYYPLNGAHAVIANECATCHNGDYNNTPNTCVDCHQSDYNATTNPNHINAQFPTDCASCHSESSWVPSTFDHDALNFPIYSGSHNGVWTECVECHNVPSDFGQFTCITCHQNPETNDQHNGVSGYSYNSSACLACHPNGEADGAFDHNSTNFPLTEAHISVDCISCHANGYQGTSTECSACHILDFNGSTNPPHQSLGFPTDCAMCHTTAPGWSPAQFAIHDNYYPLTGAHQSIANDCATCHNGNYTNTPNTCVGCHQSNYNGSINPNHLALNLPNDCVTCHNTSGWEPALFPIHNDFYPLNGAHANIANECVTCHNGDYINTPNTCVACHQMDYNGTTNPNHSTAQFPTDCASCHSENSWVPSTFDHDGLYFPIYSGSHNGQWNQCVDCHSNSNDYSQFNCITCHTNPETNDAHTGIGGYAYNNSACLACHPDGESNSAFDHNNTAFPLTGAHIGIDCVLCHGSGYSGTPTACQACHTIDYNESINPNHSQLDIPMDCAMCHSTQPGWNTTVFPIHNNYYPLTGAHAAIANDCAGCHNGDYINTPNTCVACHQTDYNSSANPNHNSLGLSTDCASCHTTAPDWSPAQFPNHNSYYQLNGAHALIANDCAACHNGNYINTPNTCFGCHNTDYNQTSNPNHGSAQFPTDCVLCHNESAWIPSSFDHDNYFVLDGAHASVDCNTCHNGDYQNTPNTCVGCHQSDYNNTSNPDHSDLNIPTDCATCHTTGPGWTPADFPIHDSYFVLSGAHASQPCAACHPGGDYTNTPNTCYGCHAADYNGANDPDHQSAGFPITCESCHTDQAWDPSTFDHDDMYFPIYSGKHKNKWDQCTDCHTTPGDFTVFNCIICHTNAHHQNQGNAGCYACHPNGTED